MPVAKHGLLGCFDGPQSKFRPTGVPTLGRTLPCLSYAHADIDVPCTRSHVICEAKSSSTAQSLTPTHCRRPQSRARTLPSRTKHGHGESTGSAAARLPESGEDGDLGTPVVATPPSSIEEGSCGRMGMGQVGERG
jgi:hypothetical protein